MSAGSHNAAIRPALAAIVQGAQTESEQWVILESLCFGIGLLHNRDVRQIATFIETMAERIVTGEREVAPLRDSPQ